MSAAWLLDDVGAHLVQEDWVVRDDHPYKK